MKQLMKLAGLLAKQQALRKQLNAIRNQTADSYRAVTFQGDGVMIVDIPLAQFLAIFPDETPRVSNWDQESGAKTAMRYGPVPAGFSVGEVAVQLEARTPWVESKQLVAQVA